MGFLFCYPAGVSPRIFLLDNDDSFTCLFADRLRLAGSCDITIVPEAQVSKHQLSDYDALIISPGPGLPNEHPAAQAALAEALRCEIPCLGICLGFQMMALSFGARLMQLREPRHGVASRLVMLPSRLTQQRPCSLQVGLYHSWGVDPQSWPSELRLLCSDSEGIPMALEHPQLALWGVQFHPESVLSPQGILLLQGFLKQLPLPGSSSGNGFPQQFGRH